MKKFAISFLILMTFMTQTVLGALPPTTVKGQLDANKSTTFNFEAPAYQFTKTGSTTGLVETGNYNLLKNPSFEATTFSDGWTKTGTGTWAVGTTTNIAFGLKSMVWTPLANAETITSTLVPIPEGLKGKSGELTCSFRVPTGSNNADFSVYNGTTDIFIGSVSTVTSTFSTVTVPFLFPSTGSVGMRMLANSSQDPIVVDDCYLGPDRRIATGSVDTDWTSYTPIFTGFGTPTAVEAEYSRVGSTLFARGKFVSGTSTVVAGRIGLPPGLSCDFSSPTQLTQTRNLGTVTAAAASSLAMPGTGPGPFVLTNDNSNPTSVAISKSTRTSANHFELANGSALVSSGESASFEFNCKIVGWVASTIVAANQQRAPNPISFAAGSSGTYTPSAGVTFIVVEMSGSGGGGSGDGIGASNGANGVATTFQGSSAGGGSGGTVAGGGAGSGGANTLAVNHLALVNVGGGSGQGGFPNASTNSGLGGNGGNNPLGGGGGGGGYTANGTAGATGTGAGGGGAGASSTVTTNGGSGGGAGGYLKFQVNAPTAASFSVAGSAAGGTAGTGGYAGGASGSGKLTVTEYFGYTTAILANSVRTNREGGIRHETLVVANNGTTCTALQSSSAWYGAFTRNGNGRCSFAIPAGTFNNPPICVCSPGLAGPGGCGLDFAVVLSATSMGFRTSTNNVEQDLTHFVMCSAPM